MRAKFKIDSITQTEYQEKIKLTPVYSGTKEDNTFAKATPSGSIELDITNSALHGTFKAGQAFYIDFTPAG